MLLFERVELHNNYKGHIPNQRHNMVIIVHYSVGMFANATFTHHIVVLRLTKV